MKLRKTISGNDGLREEKGRFPAFKGMIEKTSRTAMVLMAVSIAAPACSGGSGDVDSGRPDAAFDGSRADSGRSDSGGTDGAIADSEVQQMLCDLYAEGDPKRATFSLMDSRGIVGSNWRMEFRRIQVLSKTYAVFNYHNTSLTSGDFESFVEGVQRQINVPGLGNVRFELCATSGGECNGNVNPPTGNPACTATLVAESGWSG